MATITMDLPCAHRLKPIVDGLLDRDAICSTGRVEEDPRNMFCEKFTDGERGKLGLSAQVRGKAGFVL